MIATRSLPRAPRMLRFVHLGLAGFILGLTWYAGTRVVADEFDWRKLPPLPDDVGFAGSYAGVSKGVLLVAGGANFPGGPPWEGHAKVWHDRVFALTAPDAQWQVCKTRLPRPAAYGVSCSVNDQVLLVGGGDERQHSSEVWSMHWTGDDVTFSPGPRLPMPTAFMSGVRLRQRLYIIGGIDQPHATKASHRGWSLSLEEIPSSEESARDSDSLKRWQEQSWDEMPRWPGPERMLPVVGTDGERLFVLSGVVLKPDAMGKARRETPYLSDAFAFEPIEKQWTSLPRSPKPAAAAANAIFLNESLFVFGGDDGSLISEPPQHHPGFSTTVQCLNVQTLRWTTSDGIPTGASRVTLPVVQWRGGWVLPSGEKKPGIRSPDVYWVHPKGN